MPFRTETIRRHLDEAPCDHCGCPCYVGDRVLIDLDRGTIYCSRVCGEEDRQAVPVPAGFDKAA